MLREVDNLLSLTTIGAKHVTWRRSDTGGSPPPTVRSPTPRVLSSPLPTPSQQRQSSRGGRGWDEDMKRTHGARRWRMGMAVALLWYLPPPSAGVTTHNSLARASKRIFSTKTKKQTRSDASMGRSRRDLAKTTLFRQYLFFNY